MALMSDLGTLCVLAGLPFFVSGTVGLLRLPDIYTRLHALTKADNVGLGLVIVGLALRSSSLLIAAKLLLIWILVLVASSASCHLIARSALRKGIRPWQP